MDSLELVRETNRIVEPQNSLNHEQYERAAVWFGVIGIILFDIIIHYIVLYEIILYNSILYYIILYCIILYNIILYYIVLY